MWSLSAALRRIGVRAGPDRSEEALQVARIKKQFRECVGYELNLKRPRSFNEKMQWLKLYYQHPLLTRCADKAAVRGYVAETIGAEYLVPGLGIYQHPEDIDFDRLPDKFVLKTNHGYRQNIICRSKDTLDRHLALEQLRAWIRPEANLYFQTYEWCYRDIPPRIVCETLLEVEDGGDLKDYKVMCFNGKPELLFVCSDRWTELKVDFFDLDWNRLPFTRSHPLSSTPLEKPATFHQMVDLAAKLAAPFPFVRVDFYEVQGRALFGEMTFYPGSGMERFDPVEWDYKLGALLTLPAPLILPRSS